jgi:2',3'-cyclic-nucleotide 2'-phosphodiesterase (5'-nucleotidase family)
MVNFRSVGDVLAEIRRMASDDNLAGVLVHFNDTYFIDERSPKIPGMARVAGLIQKLRDEVIRFTGNDRLIVLHSGDYLSPSAMSKVFDGKQMVDLLKYCDVTFATIGNHEFDFEGSKPGVLLRRLREFSTSTHLLANLEWPSDFVFSELAFWPEAQPFLAITGLVGKQTSDKALKFGFFEKASDWEAIAIDLVQRARARPGIGALVVLSHMDRHEDKALQQFLNEAWGDHGFAYILGGHDHDIEWTESDRRNVLLTKCLSNCKTITVVLLPKVGLGALFPEQITRLRFHLTRKQERDSMLRSSVSTEALTPELWEKLRTFGAPMKPPTVLRRDEAPVLLKRHIARIRRSSLADGKSSRGRGDPPYTRSELLESVLHFCRLQSAVTPHPDIYNAFERTIPDIFKDWGDEGIVEGIRTGEVIRDVLAQAAAFARENWQNTVYSISAEHHMAEFPLHSEAARAVQEWEEKLAAERGADTAVADFTSEITAEDKQMDAEDTSLRVHSTDFGNFVADAIRNATGARVALINAGAFRIDSRVAGQITTKVLRDVFIYDKPGSISVVELTTNEIRAFLNHALSRGLGAFLQVSDLHELLDKEDDSVEVALVTHMLDDDEDRYQSLLALERSAASSPLQFPPKMKHASVSMVDLIAMGSTRVRYSNAQRLRGESKISDVERVAEGFMQHMDEFLNACIKAGIEERDGDQILRDLGGTIPPERIKKWNPDGLERVKETLTGLLQFIQKELGDKKASEELNVDFFGTLAAELRSGKSRFKRNAKANREVNYSIWLEAFLYSYR